MTQTQLDALEDDLKLTQTQRAPWNACADRLQKLGDDVTRLRFEARTARPEGTTAVAQLEKLAEVERDRNAAVQQIVDLARVLYDALTPDQRALADRRLAPIVMALTTGVTSRLQGDPPARGR